MSFAPLGPVLLPLVAVTSRHVVPHVPYAIDNLLPPPSPGGAVQRGQSVMEINTPLVSAGEMFVRSSFLVVKGGCQTYAENLVAKK